MRNKVKNKMRQMALLCSLRFSITQNTFYKAVILICQRIMLEVRVTRNLWIWSVGALHLLQHSILEI